MPALCMHVCPSACVHFMSCKLRQNEAKYRSATYLRRRGGRKVGKRRRTGIYQQHRHKQHIYQQHNRLNRNNLSCQHPPTNTQGKNTNTYTPKQAIQTTSNDWPAAKIRNCFDACFVYVLYQSLKPALPYTPVLVIPRTYTTTMTTTTTVTTTTTTTTPNNKKQPQPTTSNNNDNNNDSDDDDAHDNNINKQQHQQQQQQQQQHSNSNSNRNSTSN